MAKVSEAVNSRIREMYAVMATAAAQRAVNHIVINGNMEEANRMSGHAESYLRLAHAKAAVWTYMMPRIKA